MDEETESSKGTLPFDARGKAPFSPDILFKIAGQGQADRLARHAKHELLGIEDVTFLGDSTLFEESTQCGCRGAAERIDDHAQARDR